MDSFTPVSATIGGLLIGLAAAFLWLTMGRIAGISGILGGLRAVRAGDIGWRIAFVAGLIAAPLLVEAAGGVVPAPRLESGPGLLVLAGLLVGFGTRLGSGCTSGHGVCGLARVSRRSLVATALFMGTAVVTVFVLRHLIGA